ncbi:NADH-ubiquinone oxidoreductase-F iron-sulfur binding region domain-containing protein [Streptomyces sp. NPDC002817]|uniref:NADH-ubiquinone oxidoreductase-F iron-sulfur binding region domain-containing protein n=1 Tax=Streptomyces sp. NPDC088357 TaxID=3154655 RepID=UPI00344764C9
MDLHFGDSEPTDDERAAVDGLLGPASSFWEGGERSAADLRWSRGGRTARARRDLLLPGLHALNDRVGWISEGGLAYLCRRLTVPPAEAYGVAGFYDRFSVRPRPATVLRVCTDLVCAAAGAAELCAGIEARLGPDSGVSVERGSCPGLCERAPAALVVRAGDPARTAVSAPATVPAAVLAAVSPDSAPEEPSAANAVPQAGDASSLTLLRRVGVVDPSSPDDYRAHGGCAALRRAYELGPAGVLRELTDCGPVGRGAAFPVGRSWLDVASRPDRPHHLVCNADESGPGAFSSRVIMEGDPYALVEAMTIAAYAIGAHTGYLYLRDAYPRAIHRMQCAVDRGRARGLLGDDILGRGHAFDIEIRRGAGAYVCGEDTALFNAIEGSRAEPRATPPHPAEKGLFGGPTVVEDVETLINVLPVLTREAPAYAAVGAGRSAGTKLFCVSGSVDRPGVYELPFDTTPGEVLALAGVREGLRAVLLGGAAGGFVRPDDLDAPLAFDGTREAGTARGSGVVMAFDDTVPLPQLVLRIAEFFRAESCGSCVPCRIGTVRQEEALRRITERTGPAAADDLALLRDVGRAMRDASLCGVGRSAGNAVESAVDRLGVCT